MLPKKIKIGVTLGLLLFCFSNNFVAANTRDGSNFWQDGPINCYTCDSVSDCSESKGTLRKCENNNAQTCLTVFNEDSTVAQRGCSDSVAATYSSYCSSNPTKCPSCSSTGCNVADSLDVYVECLSCDSVQDSNCLLQPNAVETKKLCPGDCMTALYPTAFDGTSSNYHLVRTCLNDRDLDERTACAAGNDEKCRSCSGANCNIHLLPETRLRCYQCEGDECQDPTAEECPVFNENIGCYMRFESETLDLVQMGCTSEFENETIISDLVKSKLLYVCTTDNCNGYEYAPNPNECLRCSSTADENCASGPRMLATENKLCNTMPYTQCFQRVNSDGITERGCLAELESDEFFDCLTNANGECKSCNGYECNNEIIPNDRPKCHRCSSDSDSSCQNLPKALGVCPIYDKNDECVSVYENGITRRGCLTELSCDTNAKSCNICKGEGCNDLNIKKRAEDIFGVFQDLPLSCYSCSGEECLTDTLSKLECQGDIHQDCLTVFDATGKVVRRGCESDLQSEYEKHCEDNPNLCFNCKSNGCNIVTDATKYQECLICDSADNADCLFEPSSVLTTRKCVEGCLSSLYQRKSAPQVYDFVRSCFEDMELENRDDCTADNNCVKCTDGNKCNTQVLPIEGRLSCHHCDGADCNLPTSKLCTGYNKDEQCYMYFDNVTHSTLRMGCKSDLTDDQISAEVKQYFICDGDDCNTYENLPEANLCYVCNSATDENCAADPTKISAQARCQNYPYTDCYTRIRSDGHTERGCLSSLQNIDFLDCLEGLNGVICKVCTESNCNRALYPSGRQQCYRCNSVTDSNCEDAPSTTQACPLYDPNDSCVTKIVNDVTYRGCGTELNCNDASYKSCRSCESNNCNTLNLINEVIGDPGMFQELPLNCYQCNGTDDCLTTLRLNVCENNKLQTCTVEFNKNGAVVARGCSDKFKDACESAGNTCYDCKSNGCNTAKEKSDYVDCIFCDSQKNNDCIFDLSTVHRTRKCNKGCMTALYPRTNDAEPPYELIRTCLDDMDLDDRNVCENGNDLNCKSCSDGNCNNDDLGERKSCYHCEGDNCQDPKQQICRAVMEHDQCFVAFDETRSIVEMGCKSSYDPEDVKILLMAKRMWLCEDDNCNTINNVPTAKACAICNSRTDKNCAIAPDKVTSKTTCSSAPYTQCYTRLVSNGHTERGCLSSLEDETFYNCLQGLNSTDCVACSDASCNLEIFPEDRRSCHICNSATDDNCEVAPKSEQICLKYSQEEKCISLLNENGDTERGCSSELSCDSTDSMTCQICTANDCNLSNLKRKSDGKPGKWQDLPLTCKICDGVSDCLNPFDNSAKCTGTEYCMTVFNEEGFVVKRGCSESVENEYGSFCDANSQNCHNCNSNHCNIATSLTDYISCVYCDSESNTNCVLDPETVKTKRVCYKHCMTALYPRANSSSYALVRSCLDDKDDKDTSICYQSGQQCSTCYLENCNTNILPEDRLSCYTCTGANCEDPGKALCSSYKVNDQCYMLFNSNSDIVQMGCVSDQPDSFLTDNVLSLFVCNDANCNSFDNIPKSKLCVVCDSLDDPRCATNPDDIPLVETCSALPTTQCFTRVLSSGATQRGCVNTLSKNDKTNCLTGDGTNCVTCDNDVCNVAIYPADRRRCHRCNTVEDPTCENSPNSESVCPNYSTTERCSAKLVNGHTYRGCSSEFICDDTDKQYCRMCSSKDNCNLVDLVSQGIGYAGTWQARPINCYTCLGVECQSESAGLLKVCETNYLQNCATVFASNGTVVQRGCSDLIYAQEYGQYCDENPDKCKFCKSNGCNIATSLDNFVDCLYCDGSEDKNCISKVSEITTTRTCHQKCMTALYPRTDEENPAYELARGCLDDMDLIDRNECVNGENNLCQACDNGASCNKALIPEKRLTCNFCTESDCDEFVPNECSAYREGDQCYMMFDSSNSVTKMGCVSDLDTSFIQSHRRSMFLCDNDKCNNYDNLPVPKSCLVCKSNDNTACAVDPQRSGDMAVCSNFPNTECYTHVDAFGLTHRGCLSDVEDTLFDDCVSGNSSTCAVCDSNNCNNEIYPENRRSCHRCDSSEDNSCEDSPQDFASICPIYNANDDCVSKIEGNSLLRGCVSDFSCDTSQRDTCRICSADNCNVINLLAGYVGAPGKWQELPLNCLVCNTTEDCAIGSTLHKCMGNNLQNCITVYDVNGKVERRGCSDDVDVTHEEYCEEHADKCLACKSTGCNNANSLDDYIDCYVCDATDSQNCAVNFVPSNARTRKCQGPCMVALYPRSSSIDTAYELSRSCLDDLDLDDRVECAAGRKDLCESCDSGRCNTMLVPDDRNECYRCTDEDCQDSETHVCNAYHPNDQCYILFNDESSIIKMGCRSDFESEIVTELVKQKKLLLCDGKNCNSFGSVDTAKMCSICNSADDSRCATNPNLVSNLTRCAALPYVNCYTRINELGHTVRGCLSDLDADNFYDCLMSEDGLCDTCKGDQCNQIDVFPANRRKCHQCNSANNPLCSSSPNSNTVCPIYDAQDTCVTNLGRGVTTRGCASSMKCDNDADKLTCRVCSSSGCNTINLERIGEEGSPGRWQDIPISCLTCKGIEDCSGNISSETCEDNQNCMTVFNSEDKVIQRGCSAVVEEDNQAICDADITNCPRCNSNNCNLADSLSEYVTCLSCDTDVNGVCVQSVDDITKTRKCHKACMTALYPREQDENPAYGLARSCYDDLEIEDRNYCETGEKENCKICNGEKCNTAVVPETRLSCNTCEGDCQVPKSMLCAQYRENDKCYIRFDEQHSIEAMGCRSEFSNIEADYLLKQKRLFLCGENDCNTFSILPAAQPCSLCNSRTDINCVYEPENAITTTCNVQPYTECYSRALADGTTERGCLSSLYDDEFLGCLNGTAQNCEVCSGSSCNNKQYPTDRLKCHICDSSSDNDCENIPNSLTSCPKYDAADSCVTAYRNDITYRSCASSLYCDGSNNRLCVKCTGAGCNTVNLAKRQDDNFGKWQDLPLRCLTCAGNECKNEDLESSVCEDNNEQDCITVFDTNGEVVRRGCSDDVAVDFGAYCDQNDENCYNCKSNECNNATETTQFIDCVYCNSYKSLDCIRNPVSTNHKTRKCQGGCMTALYPADGSSNPSYDLIRTCLDDKETDEQLTCSNDKDANCHTCVGNSCNIENLPSDRLSCWTCEGENCDEPESQLCPLYKAGDKCFIWFDNTNSVSQMGCVSSFRGQELENIIKTKRVHICEGENCNTFSDIPTAQQCAICDSNDDVNCAVNPMQIGLFNTCNQLPYTSCYSKLASDGSTIRGCVADLPEDDFVGCVLGTDENCGLCADNACNRQIFPADRQQCYSCTTNEDPECESYPTRQMACPFVRDSEACVTSLSINTTVRGCSSQIYCDANDKQTCRSCFGDTCNGIDLRNKVDDGYHGMWQSLPLRCHACAGEHCKHSLGPAQACTGNIEQDCMTVFNVNGDIIRRGCTDDVDDYEDLHCRLNPELCFKCKSNECNIAWNLTDYVQCTFCNSSENALCVTNANSDALTSRSCYKECLVALQNGNLVRSCLDDKELMVQHVCRENENGKECASCDNNSCNRFTFPSDRLRCHTCEDAALCKETIVQDCVKYDEKDFCFAKYVKGNVNLSGCGSSQSSSDLETWENNLSLYKCNGNECNGLERLPLNNFCVGCDSSKTLNCTESIEFDTFVDCFAPHSECMTTINSDGDTIRGCLYDLDKLEQDSCVAAGTCASCTGPACNSELFPVNRRKCHVCNSVANSNCIDSPNSVKVCAKYVANDKCVTKKDDDGYVQRGCESDFTTTCDVNNEKNCEICAQDGCNIADMSDAVGAIQSSVFMTLLLAILPLLYFFNH
ncbi:uncharacterized protein LOC119680432 [Teleopsis dalmanni]|uniref:uncharacterized protein LOC119680432 n=1 Tax=Teleopsis dalmanni TaxID=139649 RepID=UPI0018CE8BE8|nr:uncharacterized protein LOC119680432 [Teleopsis dalmanni]